MTTIKIGTRTSQLAIRQAEMVGEAIFNAHNISSEIVAIKTLGENNSQRFGLKGVFTKEIEVALLDNKIDIAVHSAKDMAADMPASLTLAGVLPRGDVRDVLISNGTTPATINELPHKALIGTSSIRRRCLLLSIRPDLQFCELRGNINTRIEKIHNSKMHASILALSGLQRLNIKNITTKILEPHEFLPAPCQGAIAMQTRSNDAQIKKLVAKVNCPNTYLEILTERTFLQTIGATCQSPIGALARLRNNKIEFSCIVLDNDGSKKYQFNESCAANLENAKALAVKAATATSGADLWSWTVVG